MHRANGGNGWSLCLRTAVERSVELKRQHETVRNLGFHESGRALEPLMSILVVYRAVMFAWFLAAFEDGNNERPQLSQCVAGEVDMGKCLPCVSNQPVT